MPRTFSLARLLLAITAFCVLFGLTASQNQALAAYGLLLLLFAPTGAVCLTLVSFSRSRKTVLACSILGAFVGVLYATPVLSTGSPLRNAWEAITSEFLGLGIVPPFGALLFGGAALLNDHLYTRATAEDERRQQQHEIDRLLRH
jgi:hypothetical protein